MFPPAAELDMQAMMQEVADTFRASGVRGKEREAEKLASKMLDLFGGVSVGAGSYGAVVALDVLPGKVVKVMYSVHDAWMRWAILCRNHQIPFGINVEYLEANEEQGYALAIMDRYTTIDEDYWLPSDMEDIRDNLKWNRLGGCPDESVRMLRNYAEQHNLYWDLHSGNWGRKSDGSPVILDPWTFQRIGETNNEMYESESTRQNFRWFKKVSEYEATRPVQVRVSPPRPATPRPALRANEARGHIATRPGDRAALFQVWRRGSRIIAPGNEGRRWLAQGVCLDDIANLPEWPGSAADFERAVADIPATRIAVLGRVRHRPGRAGSQRPPMVGKYVAYCIPDQECERRLGWLGRPPRMGFGNFAQMADFGKLERLALQARPGVKTDWINQHMLVLNRGRGKRNQDFAFRLPKPVFVGDRTVGGEVRAPAEVRSWRGDFIFCDDLARPGQGGPAGFLKDWQARFDADLLAMLQGKVKTRP